MDLESGNALDQTMDSGAVTQPKQQNQTWNEEKKAAIHQEIRRMNQLPSNSTYAVHRLRVLNKILQLMLIQRNRSQEEELELLFASLSL